MMKIMLCANICMNENEESIKMKLIYLNETTKQQQQQQQNEVNEKDSSIKYENSLCHISQNIYIFMVTSSKDVTVLYCRPQCHEKFFISCIQHKIAFHRKLLHRYIVVLRRGKNFFFIHTYVTYRTCMYVQSFSPI